MYWIAGVVSSLPLDALELTKEIAPFKEKH
jgi:hypothetical protein